MIPSKLYPSHDYLAMDELSSRNDGMIVCFFCLTYRCYLEQYDQNEYDQNYLLIKEFINLSLIG